MAIKGTDSDGNEAIIKLGQGIVKYRMDDGFGDADDEADHLMRRFRAMAALAGRPLIDMDEVKQTVMEIPAKEMDQMEPGDEIPITVEDKVTGMDVEIAIESKKRVEGPIEEVEETATFFELDVEGDDDGSV